MLVSQQLIVEQAAFVTWAAVTDFKVIAQAAIAMFAIEQAVLVMVALTVKQNKLFEAKHLIVKVMFTEC